MNHFVAYHKKANVVFALHFIKNSSFLDSVGRKPVVRKPGNRIIQMIPITTVMLCLFAYLISSTKDTGFN